MSHLSPSGRAAVFAEHVLSRAGWLSQQPADFQDRMIALARWRSFRAGEDLYAVGDEPNAVFGLEKGLLDLSLPISGDEMVSLHRANPGFWVGDAALVAGTQRGISVTAVTDCLVLAIPADALRRHLAARPQDMAYFMRLTFENGMLALRVLAEVIALPPRARFARLLLRLASEEGVVRATQAELGALAGMSRAAFRRAFSGLNDTGIVRTEYGVVRILDRAALEAEADRA